MPLRGACCVPGSANIRRQEVDLLTLEERLRLAFPEREVSGDIAPHDCEECNALQFNLEKTTWTRVPSEFVKANDGALPLLTEDAYAAFLPAWLLQAVREPSEEVADMILVNLRHEPRTEGFTPEQASTIIDVARYITANNFWGPTDPVNVDSLAAIKAAWSPLAA